MDISFFISFIAGYLIGFISNEATHIFDLEENDENETDRKH